MKNVWLEGRDIEDEDFDVERYRATRRRAAEANRKKLERDARNSRIRAWEKTIPKRYRSYSYDNDEHWGNIAERIGSLGVQEFGDYLDNPTCFAILRGDNGLGKTILSIMMARELVGDEVVKSVEMVTGTDVLHEFSTYDAFANNGAVDPVKKYSTCDLLILDDVAGDNEHMSATQQQKLSSVLEYRYRTERLTIMTTNMALRGSMGRAGSARGVSGAGLNNYFTPRIWNRIADDVTIITFEGESMRG